MMHSSRSLSEFKAVPEDMSPMNLTKTVSNPTLANPTLDPVEHKVDDHTNTQSAPESFETAAEAESDEFRKIPVDQFGFKPCYD